MNLAKIRHASNEIERLEKALGWLIEFGVKITKDSDDGVSYRPNFAGSCNGAKEASEVLSTMMGNRLPDLIADATKNCRNTIEIHRQVIRDEASN